MNRPARARNSWLFLGSIGALSLLVAFVGFAPAALGPVPFFAVGLIATSLGLIGFLVSHAEVRSQRRLQRGGETIGRWRVSHHEWQAFLKVNKEQDQRQTPYLNSLDIKQAVSPEGLEITATERAVQIGDEFFDLFHLCSYFYTVKWIHTRPPMLEVQGRYQTKNGSYPRALRFPISVAFQKAAMDVHAAWSYRLILRNAASGRYRNPVRLRNIFAVLCMVGTLLLVSLPFVTGRSWTDLVISNFYGPVFMIGALLATVGGVSALILHFRSSKRYRAFLDTEGIRWTISQNEWRAFLVADQPRAALPWVAFNFLRMPRKVSAAGLDFIATKNGLMVGGELFLLDTMADGGQRTAQWIEQPQLCLELAGSFQTRESSGAFTLRFPVDPKVRQPLDDLCAQWIA